MITLGLSKIEVGDVDPTGAMGKDLQPLGYTYQDTCKMTQDDPTDTEHFAEEVDDPIAVVSRSGKTKVTFSVMNPSVDTLVKTLGGTKNTESGAWEAPAVSPMIEKSIRITPLQGLKFEITRARMVAKINGDFSKKGILLIECSCTVLTPTFPAAKKITATPLSVSDPA